jgi:group II intron reverse transcriptase/maturase
LEALRQYLMGLRGGWVLDVDVRKFFDSIPHDRIMELVRHRVKDSVILQLIAKWLKAGVWEAGEITISERGTPQGGVISPMLSNIFLHEVLDIWFEQVVKPRLSGRAYLIRFADDFVVVCEREDDARRILEVLPKRFEKYGLAIHPDKTRLVDFRSPWGTGKKPQTFDFLGFTHYWGKTRKGGYAVQRQTSGKKLRLRIKEVQQWCKKHCHEALEWQHQALVRKVQGHYAFYGIRGNIRALGTYWYQVRKHWQYWLNRRSRKRDGMRWERFQTLLNGRYALPTPRIVHTAVRSRQGCLCF